MTTTPTPAELAEVACLAAREMRMAIREEAPRFNSAREREAIGKFEAAIDRLASLAEDQATALTDFRRLTRELDETLNGDAAAPQASLCDLLSQVRLWAATAGEPVAFTDAHVQYVVNYGGNCRDCADHAGVCPNSGMPCGARSQAVRYVFRALTYGVRHGHIPSPVAAHPPAAQADDAGSVEPAGYTRISVHHAINHIAIHNGPGRLAEATRMLVEIPAPAAQAGCAHDWRDFYTGDRRTHLICARCEQKVAAQAGRERT